MSSELAIRYDLRYKPCIDAEVGGHDPYCEYSKKFTEDNVNERINAIATALEGEGVSLVVDLHRMVSI